MYAIATKNYRTGTAQGAYSFGRIATDDIVGDDRYETKQQAEDALAAHRKMRIDAGYGDTDNMFIVEVV